MEHLETWASEGQTYSSLIAGANRSRLKRSAVGPAHLATAIGGFSYGYFWFCRFSRSSPVFLIQWISLVFSGSLVFFIFCFCSFLFHVFLQFYKF
jgi:hypothetical protein